MVIIQLKKKLVTIFIGILFPFYSCFGQSESIFTLNIPPNDHAQNFTLQPDGFYWFGNSSGLYRFNGQHATQYIVKDKESEISHDQFIASEVYRDANAQYWFSTYQALHSLNPLTGRFKTFQLQISGQRINTGYTIFHFDKSREEILVRADTALFAFHTVDFTYRLLKEQTSANSFHSIVQDSTTLFFGAPWWNDNGIEYFEYTAGGITDFQRIDLPVMVKYIAPYTKDSLYLATPKGLQLITDLLDPKTRKLTTIIHGEARTVALDSASRHLYLSMAKQGIYHFLPKENRVLQRWNTNSGLSGDDARTIAVAGKGNVIISHLTAGVDIIVTNSNQVSYAQLADTSGISDIAPLGNGDILALNNEGKVYRKGRDDQVALSVESERLTGLSKAKIGVSANGDITAHGLSSMVSFSSDGAVTHVQKTDTSIYHGVISFGDGEKLILSNEGILSYKGDVPPEFLPGIPHGKDDFFSYLIKLSEDRFVASYRQMALWDFTRKGERWKVSNKVPTPGDTQAALPYNDGLYLGTSAGLLLLKKDSLSIAFTPPTIGNLWINALHLDAKNRLWLGTEQGLFCYYPETEAYRYFSEADGIKDDWFIRANVIADDSTFTMATKTGLVTIDTRLADATTSDNKIYLSDVWINGIRKTDHSLYAPQPLDLDFQHNAVSFLPGMIELSSSSLSGFRYRLRGLEEAYTYSKAGEVIRYPSVPPGNYVFEFVGVDKNGRSTEPFSLPVTISPPFYQTWWFWTICGASLLALFYALNRRAVRQETARQQAIQKEEARKADEKLARHQAVVSEQRRIMMELHDDLGGTLGSLFYTLDGYLLDQESGLPVAPDLELLKNTSSDAMKQLREVMKNNVAREMCLPVFVRTLTELARATAMSSRLNWKLVKDDHFPELNLNGQQVHNALLIVKEALQNIRKHAKATSFTLELHLEASSLSITLADNGVGIKPAKTDQRTDGTGNGLPNMQRRANDLGGTLTITSPPDGGTSLELRFPLQEPT